MRWPRSIGSNFYLLQLVGVAAGLVLVAFGSWRLGVLGIALTFGAGVIARFLISSPNKGMLGVRGKAFDILWMGTLAVALGVLAFTVPPYR